MVMVGTRGRNATKASLNIAVALHSSDNEGMYDMYDNEEEQEGEERFHLNQKPMPGLVSKWTMTTMMPIMTRLCQEGSAIPLSLTPVTLC